MIPAMSRSVLDAPAFTIATGLGSGYSPFAPGTAGSLVGLLLFWPMRSWPLLWQLTACVALFLVGTLCATRVAKRVGREDPGIVVVDEIVGMWVALLLVPFSAWTAAAGFVLFRAMDVVKPYPANRIDRRVEGGLGVVGDDLVAGLYAGLAGRIILGLV